MDEVYVLATGLRFPEGPVIDGVGRLWCVEQEGEGLACRLADGTLEHVYTGGRPNGAVVQGEYVWFCDSGQNAIRRLHTDSHDVETIVNNVAGKALNMPNDLLFDDRGNLLFTCPGPEDGGALGYVAVYSPNGLTEIVAENLSYPNGIVLFPDHHTLLIAETHQQRLWQGNWDADGLSWENIRVFALTNDAPNDAITAGPDGMVMGPDGLLYVAVFGEGVVRVFSEDGRFIRDIGLPGKNPTNCTFDPSGKLGLVVTEAERGELLSILVE